MATTIDELQIEIQANSTDASSGISKLASSLRRLKSALDKGSGFSGLNALANATKGVSEKIGNTPEKLQELTSAIRQLSKIRKLPDSLFSSLGALGSVAQSIDDSAGQKLTNLASGLSALAGAGNVKIPSTIGTGIASINSALEQLSDRNLPKISHLATALSALSSVKDIRIPAGIGNGLAGIGTAVEALRGVDFTPISQVATALAPLSEIGRNHLGSMLNQLERLPQIARAMQSADMNGFAESIRQVTEALAPLAEQMQTIGAGFSQLPGQIDQVANSTRNLEGTSRAATSSFANIFAVIKSAQAHIGKISKKVADWLNQSNEYIENLNLFNASMGEYAQQAQAYAEKVGDAVGIDPGQWMRNQGVFMTLATGFGVAGDRAYIMSQQLTQLGYDLASFFNLPFEESMQKLQSGISGELEPLRRLGFDLSQARLKAVALDLGIQQTFNSMTQAEKAQLRYYAIMTQVTTAHGDMARTLSAPANQLRVLQAQVTQAARALGNVFIPVLNAVLPVCIAVAKAIRFVAEAIASLFGFTLPAVDYSGITTGMGGISDGLDDIGGSAGKAGKAAKELKSYLMGFDELNIIEPDNGSGSGGGGGGGSGGGAGGSGWDWDLPTYDFLGNLIDSVADEWLAKLRPGIDWIKEHLDEILTVAKAIGAEFLMWQLAKKLLPNMTSALADLEKLMALVVALATAVITISIVIEADRKFLQTGEWGYLIADALATGLGAYIVGRAVETAFGAGAGWYSAAVVVAISAGVSIALAAGDIATNGINWTNMMLLAWGAIKGGIAGAIVTRALPASLGVKWWEGAILGFTISATIGLLMAMRGEIEYEQGFSVKAGALLAGAALAGGAALFTLAPRLGFTHLQGALLGFTVTAAIGLIISAMDELNYADGFNAKIALLLTGASLAGAGAVLSVASKLGWTKIESAKGAIIGFSVVAAIGLMLTAGKMIMQNGVSWEPLLIGASALIPGLLAGSMIGKALGVGVLMGGGIGFAITAVVGLSILTGALTVKQGLSWETLLSGASVLAVGSIAGTMLGKTLGFGVLKGGGVGFALSAAVGLALTAGAISLKEGFSWTAIGAGVLATIMSGLGGALIAVGLGLSMPGGIILGAAGGLALTAILTIAGIMMHKDNLFQRAGKWGSVVLEAAETKKFAASLFEFDIDAKINLATTTLENLTTSRNALNAQAALLGALIKPIEMGVALNATDLANLQTKLDDGNGNGIIPQMQALLDEERNALQVTMTLVPPVNTEGESVGDKILTTMGLADTLIDQTLEDYGAKLAGLIQKGMSGELDASEAEMIQKLTTWVSEITSAMTNADLGGKFLGTTEIALRDLSLETFKDTLTELGTYKESYQEALTNAATEQFQQMQARLIALQTIRDQWQEQGKDTSSIDTLISDLTSQIENYDIETSVENAMAPQMEKVRQKIASSFVDIFQVSEIFPEGALAKMFSSWAFEGLENAPIDEISSRISESIQGALNLSAEEWEILESASDIFGITEWDIFGTEVQQEFITQMRTTFGDDKTVQIMNQLGYDASGVIAQGLVDGSFQVKDEAGELVLTLKDGTRIALGKQNTAITKMFKSLGCDLVDGMVLGIDGELSDEAKALADLFGIPYEKAAEENEVHSPSQLFRRLGMYIVDGLLLGLQTLATKLSTVWTTLPGWFQTMVNKIIGTFTGMEVDVGDLFTSMATGAHNAWSSTDSWFGLNVSTPLTTRFKTLGTNIISFFKGARDDTESNWNPVDGWFGRIVSTPLGTRLSTLTSNIIKWFKGAKDDTQTNWSPMDSWFGTTLSTPLGTRISTLASNIVKWFKDAKDNTQTNWGTTDNWFGTTVSTPLGTRIKGLADNIVAWFKGARTDTNTHWQPTDSWFGTNVSTPLSTRFSNLKDGIVKFFKGAKDDTQTNWSPQDSWFGKNVITPLTTRFGGLKQSISDSFSGAKTETTTAWSTVSGWFNDNVKTPIVNLFTNGSFKTTGSTAASDLKAGLLSIVLPTLQPTVTLIKKGWETVSDWVSGLMGSTKIQQATSLIKSGWDTVSRWVKDYLGDTSVTKGISLTQGWGYSTVSRWVGSLMGDTSVTKGVDLTSSWGYSTVSSWVRSNMGDTNVSKGVGLHTNFGSAATVAAWLLLDSIFGGKVTKSVDLTKGNWNGYSVAGWVGKDDSDVDVTVNLKRGNFANLASFISGDWVKSFKINLVKGNSIAWNGILTTSGVTAKITFAEKGGIMETGQMFIAREAGPELVGSIGNRTAVANNDQIVSAVSSGVRDANSAVVDAIYTLINAVEEKDTSVVIGDDEIGRANDRYKRRRGVNVNSGAFANSY